MPLGPNPHVILPTSAIVEQRLRKRILKLTQQRDHWKSKYDKLVTVLSIFPYCTAEKTYEEMKRRSENSKRLKEYDTMVPLLVSENERLKAEVERLKKELHTTTYIIQAST